MLHASRAAHCIACVGDGLNPDYIQLLLLLKCKVCVSLDGMTWHARWQAMVDFYQNYRQGVFTTGKYDEAGAVLPKAPPLHLLHYRYQLVNHYSPVTADEVRTLHELGRSVQICMVSVSLCRGKASESKISLSTCMSLSALLVMPVAK